MTARWISKETEQLMLDWLLADDETTNEEKASVDVGASTEASLGGTSLPDSTPPAGDARPRRTRIGKKRVASERSRAAQDVLQQGEMPLAPESIIAVQPPAREQDKTM